MCWVVVSFVSRGRMQNFRPLGSFVLVKVEFLVVGGLVVIIVSNPTLLRLDEVELLLGGGFDNN